LRNFSKTEIVSGVGDMEETQPETKKCPACAEEILQEAKKCKHCGEILGSWSEQPDSTKELSGSKRRTVRTTFIVTGVLVALGAGVLGAAWVTDIFRNQTAIPQLQEMVEGKRADLTRAGLLEGYGAEVECVPMGLSWWGQLSEYECVVTDRNGQIVIYDAESNWDTGVLRISLDF
jgi:ribosomal protein L37AE/L43A